MQWLAVRLGVLCKYWIHAVAAGTGAGLVGKAKEGEVRRGKLTDKFECGFLTQFEQMRLGAVCHITD
jgi:hypothetical protein